MVVKVENLTVFELPRVKGGPWKRTKDWLRRHLSASEVIPPCLKHISCTFPCGISIVTGPNGAGKTTLLQALAGLVLPDSGNITIDGKVIYPFALRPVIGYLPQAFGLYPQLTAREMLHYTALLRNIVDRRTRERCVESVLQQTNLTAAAERKIGVYSRGMRQKVGIAQALLGDPRVLILDDPTAGLDPAERNRLRGLLAEIGQARVIVWASSLISDICLADRVLVLDRGENRFWGTPAELADYGRPEYDAQFTAAGGFGSDLLENGYREILSVRVGK